MRHLSWAPENLLDSLDDPTTPNTIEASTEAGTDTAVENLATDDLGEVWRSLRRTAFSNVIQFGITSGNYREVGLVALSGLNLSATKDQDTGALTSDATWRVRVGEAAFYPYPTAMTIQSKSANLSGVVASLQDADPYADDTTWITCTDNLANDIRVDILTSGFYDLLAGANSQRVCARVRRKASGGTNPTVAVELWEGGVFRATISASTSITSTTGQVLDLTFNPATLSDQTGGAMEIKLVATAGSTTTVEYGCIRCDLEFQDTGSNTLYDSGALTPSMPSVLGRTPQNLIHALPTSVLAAWVVVEIMAASNPDDYVEAGHLYVGPLKTTAINIDYGCSWAFEDPSLLSETPGGRVMAEERPLRRVFNGQFAAVLTQTEALDKLFDQLDRRVGLTKLMVLIQDADDTTQYHNTAGFGRLRSLDPVAFAKFQRYSRTISFVEAVA